MSQINSVTLPDLSSDIEATIAQYWPDNQAAIFGDLRRLANANRGRHWQHTLGDVAIMNLFIAGPQHPDWPRVIKPLAGQPDLLDWITRNAQSFPPDLLRMIALLHDLGKGIRVTGHEEISFRLLQRATGRDLLPGSDEALVALVIRHHGDFGYFDMGITSSVTLLPLIDDIRRYNLDLEPFLEALILMTLAEYALYGSLTAPIMRRLLTYADFLRQEFWWTHPYQQIKHRLWQVAIQQTSERLSSLITPALLAEDPQQLPEFQTRVATIARESGLSWHDFQKRFALVRIESGYFLFERCLELAPSLESYVTFAIQQLCRWLPSPQQVQAFEDGQIPLYAVNLRPVMKNLAKKNLPQIEEELANLTPVSVTDFWSYPNITTRL